MVKKFDMVKNVDMVKHNRYGHTFDMVKNLKRLYIWKGGLANSAKGFRSSTQQFSIETMVSSKPGLFLFVFSIYDVDLGNSLNLLKHTICISYYGPSRIEKYSCVKWTMI